MDIYKTLLLFALVCALAAFFVMWAKWEEEKVKTRAEREKRWDEISVRLTVEKKKDAEIAKLNACLDAEAEYVYNVIDEKTALQDELSALLCPTNNHVWKDGICTKCGRVKND